MRQVITPSNSKVMIVGTPENKEKINKISTNLSKEVSKTLGYTVEQYTMDYKQFNDSAWNVEFKESVRGKTIVVYADCYSDQGLGDLNSKYMLYRHIIRAANRHGAHSVEIVFPSFPYSRSDKLDETGMDSNPKRVPIITQLVADDMKNDGVNHVITLDMHNPAVVGQFDSTFVRISNLSSGWLITSQIEDKENTEFGSTDEGGTKKMKKIGTQLGINTYGASKSRDNTSQVDTKQVFINPQHAQITGKDIKIYDDMIDSGSTIITIVEKIAEYKPKSIEIIASHGIFSNPEALAKLKSMIDAGIITSVSVTDSIHRENLPEWINVIKTHKIFAQAIASILSGDSIKYNGTQKVKKLKPKKNKKSKKDKKTKVLKKGKKKKSKKGKKKAA